MSNENKQAINMANESNKVEQLEKQIAELNEKYNAMRDWWQASEKRAEFLLAFIKSGVKGTDFMSAAEFAKRIAEEF